MAFHTLSNCNITHNISTIYTNTNSRNANAFVTSHTTIQPKLPLHKKLPSLLVESSPWNISIGTPTTLDRVTSCSNNSNDVLQSEITFEKLKVAKLKNDLLED